MLNQNALFIRWVDVVRNMHAYGGFDYPAIVDALSSVIDDKTDLDLNNGIN